VKNFIKEIHWRGMIHDIIPETENYLKTEQGVAYVGIDPTADSLHIGHLVSVMMLKHFQAAGHKPIVLIGGATGMIGDPSGKSEERNLLDENVLKYNQEAIKKQLSKLLDFDKNSPNSAIMVNNHKWISKYSFLDFIRIFGKHITINYMMSKDAVKKRISDSSSGGMSFTEFSYQLVQAVDFLYLYEHYNCKLQMGGSDQWGNMTTGTELIRKKLGQEAYAITCPLLTKDNDEKFGKTEQGNVWLDPEKTSPYAFYQFWLNVSDDEVAKYIKIFTLLDEKTINRLTDEHFAESHKRELQKILAKELMLLIHSENDYKIATEASEVLFGKGTVDILKTLDNKTIENVFEGVPIHNVNKQLLKKEQNIIDFISKTTNILPSKNEVRRMLSSNAISINKIKVNENYFISINDVINDKYIIVQTGKKNYHLVILR